MDPDDLLLFASVYGRDGWDDGLGEIMVAYWTAQAAHDARNGGMTRVIGNTIELDWLVI